MDEQFHDLIRFYDNRNPERVRTIYHVTFDEMLDVLRTKVNLMLNRQRQSYEEERRFMLKAYIDTVINLMAAKSLLRRLVRIVKKMGGQAPKELVRLAESAQKLLKEGVQDARTNSTKTAKGTAGGRRGTGKDDSGN
jgi:hypothetical protein